MLTLFHAPRSRSSRIIWLLEELGADYALRYVSIHYNDGRGGAPDPANPHPDKKVPALLHDGALITESTAVALYRRCLPLIRRFAPPSPRNRRGEGKRRRLGLTLKVL